MALALLFLLSPAAWAGSLTPVVAAAMDTLGSPRTSFSDNERVVLQQKVRNVASSPNRIHFRFVLLGPSGSQVFEHTGNSVPGSIGDSASTVSGIPVKSFFAGSGNYTFQGSATMGGETVQQAPVVFNVSSSYIILTYPPNGTINLPENPPTFQWSSSGASRYRLTLSDSISFTNTAFTFTADQILGNSYQYNGTQGLTAKTQYFWKVEGLDAGGLVVAKSDPPYVFTLGAVTQSRDVAVTALEVLEVDAGGLGQEQSVKFKIVVSNQGSTNEANIPLRFSLGGLPAPGTPVTMAPISSQEARPYEFTAPFPSDQKDSLAVACVELFDDNPTNNCKTVQITRPPRADDRSGPIDPNCRITSCEQIWSAIKDALRGYGDKCGADLGDYECDGFEGQISCQDLADLVEGIRRGDVNCAMSGPPRPLPTPVYQPPQMALPGMAPPPPAAPVVQAEDDREWSGLALPRGNPTDKSVVQDEKDFKKLWKRLSEEEAPDVDFDKRMVLAIVTGKEDRADRIEIESINSGLQGLTVYYRLVSHDRQGAERVAARSKTPYLLKVVPKSGMDVVFERLGEAPKEEEPSQGLTPAQKLIDEQRKPRTQEQPKKGK